jgi:hypothetical protein
MMKFRPIRTGYLTTWTKLTNSFFSQTVKPYHTVKHHLDPTMKLEIVALALVAAVLVAATPVPRDADTVSVGRWGQW